MKKIVKLFIFSGMLLIQFSNIYATDSDQQMSPKEAKQFVKHAVNYALENMDPNMDYSKYVSKDFINLIDGNKFDYEQWVVHQKHIKSSLKSMKATFDSMVAESNHVAAIFRVHLIKKDGSELEVKDMGFFKIKNHKIVYVEELTRLIKGNEADKNIGSTK
jgi:hypothetical protein